MTEEYKPFTVKPEHLKVDYIKRKDKWEEGISNVDDDISHRRFNCTLQSGQVVTAFKKCIHKNEISKKHLMTCYRVVLQKLLQDPTLTEDEFISLYGQIQTRANEVYSLRAKRLKKIR